MPYPVTSFNVFISSIVFIYSTFVSWLLLIVKILFISLVVLFLLIKICSALFVELYISSITAIVCLSVVDLFVCVFVWMNVVVCRRPEL